MGDRHGGQAAGALWVQALSLRLFGFHLWAIVLPQVVEGALTVLVLYRAVRRVAGAGAGLVAALVLAVSPVTVLLNRGNISDSLLILLLVLAADATTKAFTTGKAGVAGHGRASGWAWPSRPRCSRPGWSCPRSSGSTSSRRRPRRCSGASVTSPSPLVVMVVVSLSWMTAVTAVPAHDRPYVDGSCDNSVFSQVFVYNGLDRFAATRVHQQGCSPPSHFLVEAGKVGAALGLGTASIPPGLGRLLHGPFGRDDAWVVIPSVVAAAGLLLARRRRPRTDALRAATLMWSGWAVLTWVFFSEGRYLNSYYLAALMPALAALCGLGAATAWRTGTGRGHAAGRAADGRRQHRLRPHAGSRRRPGSDPGSSPRCVIAAALAVGILGASLWRGHASVWTITCGLALAAVALVSSSAWASGSVVVAGQGPFDTPYQSPKITHLSQGIPAYDRAVEWPLLVRFADASPPTVAADVLESSWLASEDIFATGHEFLPVGGFTGEVPTPSLRQLIHYVATGRVVAATGAVAPRSRNPDIIWVIEHCAKQATGNTMYTFQGTTMQRYVCGRAAGQRARRRRERRGRCTSTGRG